MPFLWLHILLFCVFQRKKTIALSGRLLSVTSNRGVVTNEFLRTWGIPARNSEELFFEQKSLGIFYLVVTPRIVWWNRFLSDLCIKVRGFSTVVISSIQSIHFFTYKNPIKLRLNLIRHVYAYKYTIIHICSIGIMIQNLFKIKVKVARAHDIHAVILWNGWWIFAKMGHLCIWSRAHI